MISFKKRNISSSQANSRSKIQRRADEGDDDEDDTVVVRDSIASKAASAKQSNNNNNSSSQPSYISKTVSTTFESNREIIPQKYAGESATASSEVI